MALFQHTQVSPRTSGAELPGPHFTPAPNCGDESLPPSSSRTEPRRLTLPLQRAVQAGFIGLFLLILLAPTIQQLRPFVTCTEVNENRRKAEKPKASLVDIWLNRNNAAVDYEKYYNDTYGLRDLFIRLKNQIDFSVFRKSDKVHIGPGGWLFYRNVLDNQQVGLERLTPAQEQDVFQAVDRMAEHLRRRGITLIVMPCPQKNVVYPEYVPISAPRRPNLTFFDRYRAFLKSNPRIVFVDATDILLAQKKTRDVFYRTDFHWTDVAAYFAGAECLDRIGRCEGHTPRYHELRVRQETMSGGQAMFIPMLSTPQEVALFPEKTWVDNGRFQDHVGPYLWVYRRTDGQGLPTLVVAADSFFDGMLRSGFVSYFKEVYRARGHLLSKLLKALPEGTKYLLVEHIEVSTVMAWSDVPTL